MKKMLSLAAIVLLIGLGKVQAQEKDKSVPQEIKEEAKDVGHDIKKGAKKAGHKTAEVASKGKAKITDEEYKDKVGPNGQTIYIDNHSRYYWIDNKGHRHYVNESALKNK